MMRPSKLTEICLNSNLLILYIEFTVVLKFSLLSSEYLQGNMKLNAIFIKYFKALDFKFKLFVLTTH